MSAVTQLSDYQLQLAGFEGPLDVLLRLIEQQKLSVSDVSLVAVSGGFLGYVAELQNPPPQLLADFARVAARLLVIKSRSLLPEEAGEQPEDNFDDLATQLKEYRRARQLARQLQESESRIWRAYSRSPLAVNHPMKVRFAIPPLERLQHMMEQVRERLDIEPGIVALSRMVSTAEMTRRILNVVLRSSVGVRFGTLINWNDRTEVIAGFIALLSLLHSQRLEARQSEIFGPIDLIVFEEAAGDSD